MAITETPEIPVTPGLDVSRPATFTRTPDMLAAAIVAEDPYSTVAAVKSYLGIPAAATEADADIEQAIAAADNLINGHVGRTFGETRATRYYYARDLRTCDIDPCLRVSATVRLDVYVHIETEQPTGYPIYMGLIWPTEYGYEPFNAPAPVTALINRLRGWPNPPDEYPGVGVSATFSSSPGGVVPAAIVQASVILAARLYQRRSSPLGITAGAQEYGPMRIARTDPDVSALLEQFRIVGVA